MTHDRESGTQEPQETRPIKVFSATRTYSFAKIEEAEKRAKEVHGLVHVNGDEYYFDSETGEKRKPRAPVVLDV